MEQFEHLEETQLSSEAKYDGTLLHIRRDTVRLPDGKTATREYNIHNGAVCIIPLLENGEVLLERQYRYPLREVITEIPAGKLDAPDEDPLEAAQRERLPLWGGFLHVPYLPAQTADKPGQPSMALTDMVRGVTLALEAASIQRNEST